jgi:beta-N-acetylhexosaminidase
LLVIVAATWLVLEAFGTSMAGGTSSAGATAHSQRLSVAQLAGQRVVYAYAGLNPPASLLGLIRAGEAAGVILFGPNVASRAQIRGAIEQLQHAALSSSLHTPLLILTDQEGGVVRRLSGPPVLSERQIGQSAHGVAVATASGSGAGQNLSGVGINVNLAPVLDVYRRPGNFIDQFGRSYSSDPKRVASLGAAFITAQQRTPVGATAKHFPGLGAAAAAQNTDQRPVTLAIPLNTLRQVDEAPYVSAIAVKVQLVMPSWAIYPVLDSHRPAGLSSIVLQRELRQRLGFAGVTVSDGIEAGALAPFGGLGRRGLLAAQAGDDLILCSANNPAQNTPAAGSTVLKALEAAIRNHQLSMNAAQQAADRVLALRAHP